MEGKAPRPFALAIATFISDIKHKEDTRSPFYKEVLAQINNGALENASAAQSEACADHLDAFIKDLQYKQKRNSRTLRIADRLSPLVSGLSQYTQAFDTMIQAAPSAVMLLYGGAKLVLQLAQDFSECFDTVLTIMEDIGLRLQCYNRFSTAYESSPDWQKALVESYKNIVSFWQKVSRLLSRKPYKTFFIGIVKPLTAEWAKYGQKLQNDSARLQLLSQATEAAFRRRKDLEQADHRQRKIRKRIVDWIKAGEDDGEFNIPLQIRTNMGIRYENTCEWLFEDPRMENWLSLKRTTALWYIAPPGAGKTILSSAVARKLQDKDLRVAAFFYSFNNPVRRKAITALRCLALQLLPDSEPIPDTVQRLYDEDIKNHFFKLNDINVAVKVVEALIKQVSRIHIIVDGLDECHDPQQLFNSLRSLLEAKTYGMVKWFFASRQDHDIRNIMRKHGVTEIEAPQERLISDIRQYVADRFKGKLDHDCKVCIERWTSKSEGNFLWVYLMLRIREGEDLTCEEEIEEELNKFPKGLTGCYTRCLAQLSNRPENHQQLARRIFTMIVGAAQPLSLSELRHALGAARGGTDYSPKSLPEPELIKQLCSNIVLFDYTSKGSESDPVLKIAHKSIQDFFFQDPNSLGIREDLRQYFVSIPVANLELGRASLAYLNYVRYHQPQDITTIIETEHHAFLRHAATFWHCYLRNAGHSTELFNKVEDFVRSQAFWTCVAVQTSIAPHLFARYREIADGCYQLESTGPQQDEEEGKVSYPDPLPQWLEEYEPSGRPIVQAFHNFIREWHPVLNSHPSAADQCAMDQGWERNMPGRSAWLSNRVKLFCLSRDRPGPSSFSSLSVMDVSFQSGGIMVAIFGNQILCDGCNPQWLHLHIISESVSSYLDSQGTMPVSAGFSGETHIFSRTFTWDGPYSVVDPSCLRVQQYDIKSEGDLARVSDNLPPEPRSGKWHLVCKTTCGSYGSFSSNQRAVAFHCAQNFACKDNLPSNHDSGFGPNNSHNDSDSDISDDSTSESETTLDEELTTHNCMLFVQNIGPPIWHFWKSTNDQIEARCAFHPIQQLAVWSPSAYKFCIIHLTSGEFKSTILPEPADIQFSSVTAMRKEFQFSESGDLLHYLLYTAIEKETGIQQTISVSSFNFTPIDDGCGFLWRMYPTQTVSYECTGPIYHPMILVSWTSEYVYIALPPLSCNAKILRLRHPHGGYSGKPASEGFQTLCNPVYFPYTTLSRNPRIKVLDRDEGREIFTLALDAEISSASRLGDTGPVMRQPPALMVWDIDRKHDWRDWKSNLDERSEELRAGRHTYDMLRGTFVDVDRRFNVPVRSGLDWRKKAFLSCA